jgi:HEAT repeat protein
MKTRNITIDPRFVRRCWFSALLLLLSLPMLRLVEAVARLIFLPSFYDSFEHALTAEMWFSPLWWLYTNTTLGWCVSRALVLWIVAVPLVVLLPWIRRRKAYTIAVACTCFFVLAVVTTRLESHWDGQSDSVWGWCLRSRDPELRRQAALGLSHHSFRDEVPEGTILLARQGLHDEVLEVRRFSARFFTKDRAKAGPELAEALSDSDAQVRSDAALALAQRGSAAANALPQLKVCLNDPVPVVRAHAAEAYLAGGGDPDLGVSTLEQVLPELNHDERYHLGWVLPTIAAKHPDAAMPLRATPLLDALLWDKDRDVRYRSMWNLEKLGPKAKPLTPTLLLRLKDSDYFIRSSAARALGYIESPDDEVVADVVLLLKDPEWWVRRDAAHALGDMGAVQAIPALKEALNDPESLVSSDAKEALDRLERGLDRHYQKRK